MNINMTRFRWFLEIFLSLVLVFCFFPHSSGSQALQQYRQELDEDHAAGAREPERGAVLHGRRHPEPAAAPHAGAAGDLPEVAHWLPWEETSRLPALLLCLRSCSTRDPRPSQRLTYYTGMLTYNERNLEYILYQTRSPPDGAWLREVAARVSGIRDDIGSYE